MRLSSHQDFSANQASGTAQLIRLNQFFPEMESNTRAINSDLQIKFQSELHDAMGYRRDNCDDF